MPRLSASDLDKGHLRRRFADSDEDHHEGQGRFGLTGEPCLSISAFTKALSDLHEELTIGGVSRVAKGADCKSAGYAFVGSSPTSPTIMI